MKQTKRNKSKRPGPGGSRIARQLAFAIIIFSSLITLVVTSFQLYNDYRRDLKQIKNYFNLISESYIESLTKSVWMYDESQILTVLEGLLKLPDIEYLNIQTDSEYAWSSGYPRSRHVIQKSFPLIFTHQGRKYPIGTLSVTASMDNVYGRLIDKALTILFTNALKTFLVAGFILMIFQFMVTRHLTDLAAYVSRIDIKSRFDGFHLKRKASRKKEDELDQVAQAINRMHADLFLSIEQLKKNEAKYRELVQNAGSAILRITSDGTITFFNEFSQTLFGYSSDEMLGRNIFTTIMPEHTETGEIKKQILNPHVHPVIEIQNIRKDGTRLWVSWSSSGIGDESGTISEILCVGIDITKRKQAEAEKNELQSQLRHSLKIEAMGTLAGGIAHDFNNILSIIIGNAELAMDDLPEWNSAGNNLNEIITASLRARDIVQQLLSFTRKMDQKKKAIEINAIIEESIRLLRSSLPSSIDIRADIPRRPAIIMADSSQIHQVIINLCTNAAHAMQDSGGIMNVELSEIQINSETAPGYPDLKPGRYAQLIVRDTGHGIRPEIIERVFDPYFTTKEVGKGSGMGLSVVHGIVKDHDGGIRIISEPGKGTTIEVVFPFSEAEMAPDEMKSDELPTGSERILLIDDENAIIKIGRRMLEKLGYRVTAKTNPEEAVELFRLNPEQFDLVITDMTMPKMNGAQLIAAIREIRPSLPVILCTGFSEKIDRKKASQIGIRHYIEKPLVKRDLAILVRDAIDGE